MLYLVGYDHGCQVRTEPYVRARLHARIPNPKVHANDLVQLLRHASLGGKSEVRSSSLRSVGYDQEQRVLDLESTNGAVYQYFDVPPELYSGLMAAKSHGRYFHQHVRDKSYRYQKTN